MGLTKKRKNEITELLLDEFLKNQRAGVTNSDGFLKKIISIARDIDVPEEEMTAYIEEKNKKLVKKIITQLQQHSQ